MYFADDLIELIISDIKKACDGTYGDIYNWDFTDSVENVVYEISSTVNNYFKNVNMENKKLFRGYYLNESNKDSEFIHVMADDFADAYHNLDETIGNKFDGTLMVLNGINVVKFKDK